jgi:hypothetical protein
MVDDAIANPVGRIALIQDGVAASPGEAFRMPSPSQSNARLPAKLFANTLCSIQT